MNWNLVEGKWKELKGIARAKWGKLTDEDLETVAGKKDELIGRLQQRYGMKKEAAEAEIDGWLESI